MRNIPSLSFCITCKNRLHQIKKTLKKNLRDNFPMKHRIDFVLVDFSSNDGLQEWIIKNFEDEIRDGYLKYYWTAELKEWHASIAKNTAHILAKGDILVNLDCDNFTGKDGGLFVLEKMLKLGIHNTVLHQFSNDYSDGTFGRISMSKKNFVYIGGYNEDFYPMGYQDVDLITRLMVNGLSYMNFENKRFNKAIPNTKEEGLKNVFTLLTWNEMNFKNSLISRENITNGRLISNVDKQNIGIIDNIFSIR
ncbi:glycosyltransferase family 2 protein [Sphingobacterium sp. MYb382]|uniref:glycosyltransferase family 2 protein n=1 Tax=Sphingobacterium sp. MYb382 TaxID=2745278 RepID=UPI0030994765